MMTSGELFCMGSIVGALILGGILAIMTTIRSSQISRHEEAGVYRPERPTKLPYSMDGEGKQG